jgi:hypothetical protein
MTRRLATIYLMTMLLIGIATQPVHAQATGLAIATLKGISAVAVAVEQLPDRAKAVGLTEESIQTDVELKLRLAGMRVVPKEEVDKVPGAPWLYVRVNVRHVTDNIEAAHIDVFLCQGAILERNGQVAPITVTWFTGQLSVLGTNAAETLRDETKDLIDEFLNDWLSVNPKK